MPVSKPDYIGLNDLPARISKNNPPKDDLVKYFICLCAGKTEGNGAIANKAEITPIRGEMFGSWLYVAKLISEDGKLTEYGMQELELLRAQKKDYVAGLLGENMLDEHNYFLGIESDGNSALLKEPGNVSAETIPEKQEFVFKAPVTGYVEQKKSLEDILNAGGEPSGHELLEAEQPKNVHSKTEAYELEILEKIKSGITDYRAIAENVGIKPSYASLLMSHLQKCGCTKGRGKDRIITGKGISDLKSNRIDKPKIFSKTTAEENKIDSNQTDRHLQPTNSEMLKQVSSELPINPAETKEVIGKFETLKYEVLKQIYRGVINNGVIAKNVGEGISAHDVSSIVGMLRGDGCVEGRQSKRRITHIGIEKLNQYKAGYDDVPTMIEPVRQVSEVKYPAEIEPVQTQELTPFPSLSYHGLSGKKSSDETRNKAFGQKQVDKYVNNRWYANMPKSEGSYAKSKEKIECSAEELPKSAILTEEIPAEPKEAVASVTVADISEIITGHTEPIEHEESELQLLAFLLGCEFKITQDEMAILFEGKLYLFESQLRRSGYFTKPNGLYTLKKPGSDKLDSLKQNCHGIVPKYLDVINYIRENKKMPPGAESSSYGDESLNENETGTVPELPGVELSEKEICVEKKMPENPALLLYPALEELQGKNVNVQEIMYAEPVTASANTEPEQIVPVAPSQQFLTITKENVGELAKDVGLLKKGLRYIIPSNENPRTIVAGGRFQQIGMDYLRILQGTINVTDAALFTEMKSMGLFEGANGNKRITEKGSNAERVLEWLKEYYKGAA